MSGSLSAASASGHVPAYWPIPSLAPGMASPAGPPPTNLIVNYIPIEVTEAELRAVFEQHGEVESARIITDRNTGMTKGYGFVRFKRHIDAAKAQQHLTGFEVYGKRLRVGFASDRDAAAAGVAKAQQLTVANCPVAGARLHQPPSPAPMAMAPPGGYVGPPIGTPGPANRLAGAPLRAAHVGTPVWHSGSPNLPPLSSAAALHHGTAAAFLGQSISLAGPGAEGSPMHSLASSGSWHGGPAAAPAPPPRPNSSYTPPAGFVPPTWGFTGMPTIVTPQL